jgi:hypothetical protein
MTGHRDGPGMRISCDAQPRAQWGRDVRCLKCEQVFHLRAAAIVLWANHESLGYVGGCCVLPAARDRFEAYVREFEAQAERERVG